MIEVTIALCGLGHDSQSSELLRDIVSDACDEWGGCTIHEARHGYWVGPDGKVVSEWHWPLVVAIPSLFDLALVAGYARQWGRLLGEHSVYVSALGHSEIVEVGQ